MDSFTLNEYVIFENQIFGFDTITNLPIRIDIKTGRLKYIENIQGYQGENSSVDKMCLKDGKIYAGLTNGKKILKYDILEQRCIYYDVGCGELPWGNWASIDVYEDKIIILPRYEKKIYIINEDKITSYNIEGKLDNCILTSCKIQNEIWFFLPNDQRVFFFDLVKNTLGSYNLPMKYRDVVDCTYNAGYIYLLSKKGIVYELDCKSMKMKVLSSSELCDDESLFAKVVALKHKLFLFPSSNEDIYTIDIKTTQLKKYSDYPKDFKYFKNCGGAKYYGVCEDEENIYLIRKSNYLLIINKNTLKIEWLKIYIPSSCEALKQRFYYSKGQLFEKKEMLEEYINYVKEDDAIMQKEKSLIGNEIWKNSIKE